MDARNSKTSEMSDKAAVAEWKGFDDSSRSIRAEVVEAASTADEDKLAMFLRIAEERQGQLMRMAQRITSNREDAEEVVQEALLRAFKNLPNFRGDSKMETWLCVIVRNIGRERLRKRKGFVFLSLERDPARDDDPPEYDLPDPGRTPEQLCVSRELESILLSEIDGMKSVCKRTIEMCAFEELSHVEVASALGINAFTVKSRLLNGRRKLKRAICLRTGMRDHSSRPSSVTL